MKAYSLDLREKIVAAHTEQKISIRQVARIFTVSKSLVQKLVKQQQIEGNVTAKKSGKPQFSYLTNPNAKAELKKIAIENSDATIAELCELFAQKTGNWVSRTAMSRQLQLIVVLKLP